MVKVWQIAFATLLIYAAGVFTGGMLVKVTNTRGSAAPQVTSVKPPESRNDQKGRREGEWRDRRKQFMDHMAKDLGLSPEQRTKVEAIIKEGQDRIRNRVDPITKEEFDRTHEEMLKEFTPEQQRKANEFRDKMRNGPPPERRGDNKDKSGPETKPEACKSCDRAFLSSAF